MLKPSPGEPRSKRTTLQLKCRSQYTNNMLERPQHCLNLARGEGGISVYVQKILSLREDKEKPFYLVSLFFSNKGSFWWNKIVLFSLTPYCSFDNHNMGKTVLVLSFNYGHLQKEGFSFYEGHIKAERGKWETWMHNLGIFLCRVIWTKSTLLKCRAVSTHDGGQNWRFQG